MTLLEILLHELDEWPEGTVSAYQSISTSEVYFDSTDLTVLKTIRLCRIASERGPVYKVTREEWEIAKIMSLPFFKEVSAALGEEEAVKELLVAKNYGTRISSTAEELSEAFAFACTPQGLKFWADIAMPNRDSRGLKEALHTITAALKPELSLQLQSDGTCSVQCGNEVISFTSTDYMVNEYLNLVPKFDHWHMLQDRFQWIAKDQDGGWWAYEDQPTRAEYFWKNDGECLSLKALKVEIPCHWSNSLIERPAHTTNFHGEIT